MRGSTGTVLCLGLLAAGIIAAKADDWTGIYIGIGGGIGATVHELSVEKMSCHSPNSFCSVT